MRYKELEALNGVYRVYEDGTVMSNIRKTAQVEWHELHQGINTKGYHRVWLSFITNQKRAWRVHRLVAKCFLDPPDISERNIINHKDGDKSNNHYSNLEWCTQAENMVHAKLNGLIGSRKDIGGKPVSVTFEFPTARTAERFLNLEPEAIARLARGKTKFSQKYPITDVHYIKEKK